MTTTAAATGMHAAEDVGALAAAENAHQATPASASASAAATTAKPAPARSPPRRKTDAEYIPPHLAPYMVHSQDDFYIARSFDPVLLAHLMFEGFLPIASEYRKQCFLLPKLHRKRCILLLDTPEHVPKSVKKRAKKYKLVLNKDFDGVVAGCHAQHGIPWLYPPIVAGFRALFDLGAQGIELFRGRRVRFYSVELLDVVTNELVAGELGYTVGKVYTSLTGFSRASGAGTVQLHALSKLLYLSGIEVWDLGMSMPYKMSLGASDEPRDTFLRHLYTWRTKDCLLHLDDGEGDLHAGAHVKVLFEISRPKSIGRVPGIHSDDEDDETNAYDAGVDIAVQDGTERLHVEDDEDDEIYSGADSDEDYH